MKAFNHKSSYWNVDFQGEGAYVVLPPSIHPNGNRYRWFDGLSPDECDLMILPDYLIEEIKEIIGVQNISNDGSRRQKEYRNNGVGVNVWGEHDDDRDQWARCRICAGSTFL